MKLRHNGTELHTFDRAPSGPPKTRKIFLDDEIPGDNVDVPVEVTFRNSARAWHAHGETSVILLPPPPIRFSQLANRF